MNDTEKRINKMLKKSEVILNAGKPKSQTNEEWFCKLAIEEKAKVLGKVSFCDFCPYQLKERCAWTTGYGEDCIYGNGTSEDAWLAWLKEVHE